MRKIICNRCGIDIEKDKNWIVTFDIIEDDPICHDDLRYDLCPHCFATIKDDILKHPKV